MTRSFAGMAKVAVLVMAALFAALYIELFLESCCQYWTGIASGLLSGSITKEIVFRFGALFLLLLAIEIAVLRVPQKIQSAIFEYRWYIGAALILLCTLFEISGSSISAWASLLPDNEGQAGVLWGVPRSIRSDEFATGALWTLSQDSNSYDAISQILRGDTTDTRLVYSAPSWSLITVFRPLLWGYLLFGFSHGLAFFWSAKYILLFLVTFETAYVFMRKRCVALVFAALVVFSPAVQWWGTGEMLLIGQALVLSLENFLHARLVYRRMVWAALIAWMCGCYILTLYPAWMVPFFFIFALMGGARVYAYVKDRHTCSCLTLSLRDFIALIAFLAVSALGVAISFLSSSDVLAATSSTVYPGARFETGGNCVLEILNFGAPLLYAIESPHVSNCCELAAVFSLFPLGTLFAGVLCLKGKASKRIAPFVLLQLFFVVFCFVGFPEFLAKITLMSNVPAIRLLLPMGYLELFILFCAVATYSQNGKRYLCGYLKPVLATCLASLLAIACAIGACILLDPGYLRALYVILIGLACCVVVVSLLVIVFGGKEDAAAVCVAIFLMIAMIPGLCINPVQHGTSVITKTDLHDAVKGVLEEDADSLWAVEGSWTVANLCAGYGAPTLNSTNAYPDLARWETIDTSGEYREVYNRYAHIVIKLSGDVSTFSLNGNDIFTLALSYEDLRILGIRYLVTANEYNMIEGGIGFSKVAQANGYSIYELCY